MTKKKKIEEIEKCFKPDQETGISEWREREDINKYDLLKMSNNGNIRFGVCFAVDKYKWDIKRRNDKVRGKVLAIRTIGYSEKKINTRPIRSQIKTTLLDKFKTCRHCGSHSQLVIDHKNDMYNDKRVLCEDTQTINDFQILCNRCNKDLKGQANKKEKKTGIIHSVKDLQKLPFSRDNFDYPWEKAIRKYDEEKINCKVYSYWYDVDEFYRKREIFVMYTKNINRLILKKVKLIL